MKTYKITIQQNWIAIELGYYDGKTHLDAINKVNTNVKRINNSRFREIETTNSFYYVEDILKGGKTLLFEINN